MTPTTSIKLHSNSYGSPEVVAKKTDPRPSMLVAGKNGTIDLSRYAFPAKNTPLAKQLAKLSSPTDSSISYFSNLLEEKSEQSMNR